MTPDQKVTEQREIQIACILFAAVGVGYLFPFSALTSPVDYWKTEFPDFNIEFPLTTLYLWSNLLFLFAIVFFGGTPSYTFRIVGGFCGQMAVLVMVPTFYFLQLHESTHYLLVMGATCFAAFATAFVDSVAISFASQYPLRVQEALQFGIGFSTLIGSVYRLITKAVFPPSEVVASSLLYFYTGAATIFCCIGAYYYLLSLPISKRYVRFGLVESESGKNLSSKYSSINDDDDLEMTATARPRGSSFSAESSPVMRLSPSINKYRTERKHSKTSLDSGHTPSLYYQSNNSEVDDSAYLNDNDDDSEIDRWALLKKVWFKEFIVFLLFFSTLLLWPPLITEMKSFNFPVLQETQWWPLLLLTLFSAADCFGRVMTPYRGCLNANNIWRAVMLRFSLFPLIVCSVKGMYFTNDAYSVLFVFLLGATNGYLGTLTILMVNESVTEKEKGVTGTFTGFFLNLGLVMGATAAISFQNLVLQA